MSMLENLNLYLPVSLSLMLIGASTLDAELKLIEALLTIASIRLDGRVRYAIDVPSNLRSLPLAPLLLQPLVENALSHGIEPSIAGGEIRIHAMRQSELLELSVSDTGVGLGASGTVGHGGLGLANVRARLRACYDERANFVVGVNSRAAQGVTATL